VFRSLTRPVQLTLRSPRGSDADQGQRWRDGSPGQWRREEGGEEEEEEEEEEEVAESEGPDYGPDDEYDEGEALVCVCPDGARAGDVIVVTTPSNGEVEVIVPDGVTAGTEFEVWV
jgi:hypothetical protein